MYNQIFVIAMMSIIADITDIMTNNDEDLEQLKMFTYYAVASMNKELPRNFELFPHSKSQNQ